jgi:hypothetical protein
MEPPEAGTSHDRTEWAGNYSMETDGLAHSIFVDESWFLLNPAVRKPWSPIGPTPILAHRDCHDRISGIAASPRRFHCTLYCPLFEDAMHGEEASLFLRHLPDQVPGRRIAL